VSANDIHNRGKSVLIDEPEGDPNNNNEYILSLDTKNFTVTFDFNALYVVNGIRIYTWYLTSIGELRVRLFSEGSWIILPSRTNYITSGRDLIKVENIDNTLAEKVEIQFINGNLTDLNWREGWGFRQVQVSGWKQVQVFGCSVGYVCRNSTGTSPNKCSMPTISEECSINIGCESGYICDTYTSLCRKPEEAENCTVAKGCTDGLRCVNSDLLARWTSRIGNILVNYFDVLPSPSFPAFGDMLPTWTTYADDIQLRSDSNYTSAIFEGILSFPSNGTWSLNINSSNMMYRLLQDNVSLIQTNGDVPVTMNSVYITVPHESIIIRLECAKKSTSKSFLLLYWSGPNNNQSSPIPSNQWKLSPNSRCEKPFLPPNLPNRRNMQQTYDEMRCNPAIGCQRNLLCINNTCTVSFLPVVS
jgi:hypothetical protein